MKDNARDLLDGIAKGRMIALARAISHIESGSETSSELFESIDIEPSSGERIGVTGPPGTGKSTLVAELAAGLRASEPDRKLGIVAVDPSSPFSGGALLGDRLRMAGVADDPGVFIRSMASRGALGGLAVATDAACDLLSFAGYGRLIVETVGVGQSEVDIASSCETTIVVLNPESGDSVQAIKAGLMEIADILVVNKGDHPRAKKFASDVASGLELRAHGVGPMWQVPVVPTIATEGEGSDDVIEALKAHQVFLQESGEGERRREERIKSRLKHLWRATLINTLESQETHQEALESKAQAVLGKETTLMQALAELVAASRKA